MSLTGAAVSALSFGLIVFLFLLELLGTKQKPYMGIIAFVILPSFVLGGVFLFVLGIYREHKREKHGKSRDRKFPTIDLNNPRHRAAFTFFSISTILLLLFTAFGSYQAYEFTDSDEFCGEICHKVMEPEYTAYQFSPHARVGCVQCHIGSGAEWYVRSKFSGAYQVYSVLFNKYSKPIPTPIENLRPAQETCEQCHWPKHFFSEKQLVNTYYLSDEKNTEWTLDLLIRIGGGNIEAGPTSGIHWHMNIAHEVNYVAIDSLRMIIPWVSAKSVDGKVSIYRNPELKVSDEQIEKYEKRRMDCIDCHNRPSHIYHPPSRSINHLIRLGWIDKSLPYVKSLSVDALEQNYTSKEVALDSIKTIILDFYSANYPKVFSEKRTEIDNAIEQVQKTYSRNYFPSMRVSWRKFPEHIGHLYAPGCFRCHDGKHVNEEGKVLSRDCNVCHTILAQKFEKGTLRLSLEGVDYRHPVDIGDAWKEINCSECHGKK
jgi:nitrate/TMAO reductase-like tetraheme cytochrome c subunit